MVTARADTSYFADESSGNEAPRLFTFQRGKHCGWSSRRSANRRIQEVLWRKRFLERLISSGAGSDGASSVEEYFPGTQERSKNLAEALFVACNNAKSSRTAANAKALKHLPRPSDVVPDIEHPSASDAGLSEEEKKSHRHRIVSSGIQTRFLDRNGVQQPVPLRNREDRGLKRYTNFMDPPEEDWFIRPYRVPAALLSRSYRGSLLATRHPSSRRRKRYGSKRNASLSDDRPNSSSVAEHMSIADLEYWVTTSDSGAVNSLSGKEQVEESVDAVLLAASAKRRKENEEVLKQVLAENKSESERESDNSEQEGIGRESKLLEVPSLVTSTSVPEVDVKSSVDTTENVSFAKEPEVEKEMDLFDQLSMMISTDTKALFDKAGPPPAAGTDTRKKAGELAAETEKGKRRTLDAEPVNLSPFGNEVRKGMEFCTGKRSGKRIRGGVYAHILKHEPREAKRKRKVPQQKAAEKQNGDVQKNYLQRGKRMIEKMGFTGRLGAREDGAVKYLRGKKNQGRSGIGLKPSRDLIMSVEEESGSISPTIPKNRTMNGVQVDPTSTVGITTSRHGRKVHVQPPTSPESQNPGRIKERMSDIDLIDCGVEDRGKSAVPANTTLVDDDEFETDSENEVLDNGRRAIVLDIDAVLVNGWSRRVNAFTKMVEASDCIPSSFNLDTLLQPEEKDLCDADLIEKILLECGADSSSKMIESLQASLNEAFKTGEKAEWSIQVMDYLKNCVGKVHFGFFHRGNRSRMDTELEMLGVNRTMFNGPRVTVEHGEDWPYLRAWKGLLLDIGVRACQALFVCWSPEVKDMLNGSVIAGAMLGAPTMIVSQPHDGVRLTVNGVEAGAPATEMSAAPLANTSSTFLDAFLREKRRKRRKRRVLAEYHAEWRSAVVEFGAEFRLAHSLGKSLLRFDHDEKLEWVCNEDIVGLERKNFRKLRDADFPAMFEPEDVGIL